MKFLYFILCSIFLGSVSSVSAQFQIRGILHDSQNQPIEFGEILLSEKNLKTESHSYSDQTGVFYFEKIAVGIYDLRIIHLGSIQKELQIIVDKDTDLGVLLINSHDQLSEILITAKKNLVETQIDRTVYHVENSINASSGDALEALRSTPGLGVSNEGIKILGKTGVSVMINDKLVQLSGEDLNNYLKTLSASDIQKIEVITTPPAKYEALGNHGIVNIALKPKRENSWKDDIRLNYYQGSYANFRLGNTFTYSKDKFSLQATANAANGNHGRVENMTNLSSDETWISLDPEKTQTKSYNAKIAMDYQLTPQSTIATQYMRNGYNQNTIWNHAHTQIFDSNELLSSELFTNSTTESKDNYHNLNLSYDYKIDTLGKKMSVNMDYFNNDKFDYRPFESALYYNDSPETPQTIQAASSGDFLVNIYSAKLDFEHPMKALKLEYGAKVTWINNRYDSKYYDRNSHVTVIDADRSNQFDYEEQGQAIYLSTHRDWSSKWMTKAGLRLERTQTTAYSQALNQKNKQTFTKLFPTIYLQYQPSENHVLNLNYNKRVSRPSFWALNPFRWYIDPYTYTEGNPFLEPFYTDKIELSYNYKKNWTSKIDYSKTKNGIIQILNIDEQTKTRVFTQENHYILEKYSWSQNYTFSKYIWWQSINGITVTYNKTDLNQNSQQVYVPRNGVEYYFSSVNTFKINSRFSFEINGAYNSKSNILIYKIDPSAHLNLGFSYKMMNDQLNISCNVFDVFRTSASKVYTQTGDTLITYNNYYDNRYANLGITYSFGNKNIKAKEIKSGNEDERNRT